MQYMFYVLTGRSELLQGQLESARQDIDDKRLLLVESERAAVRQVMIEQRSHFCQLVCHLKPVLVCIYSSTIYYCL